MNTWGALVLRSRVTTTRLAGKRGRDMTLNQWLLGMAAISAFGCWYLLGKALEVLSEIGVNLYHARKHLQQIEKYTHSTCLDTDRITTLGVKMDA